MHSMTGFLRLQVCISVVNSMDL